MTSPSTAYCRKSPYGLTREPSRPPRARDPPPGVNGRSLLTGPVFRGGSIWPGARVDYMSHYSSGRPVSGAGQPGRTGLPAFPFRAIRAAPGEAGRAAGCRIWPERGRAAPGLLSRRAAAGFWPSGQDLGRGGRSEGAGGLPAASGEAGRGKGGPDDLAGCCGALRIWPGVNPGGNARSDWPGGRSGRDPGTVKPGVNPGGDPAGIWSGRDLAAVPRSGLLAGLLRPPGGREGSPGSPGKEKPRHGGRGLWGDLPGDVYRASAEAARSASVASSHPAAMAAQVTACHKIARCVERSSEGSRAASSVPSATPARPAQPIARAARSPLTARPLPARRPGCCATGGAAGRGAPSGRRGRAAHGHKRL